MASEIYLAAKYLKQFSLSKPTKSYGNKSSFIKDTITMFKVEPLTLLLQIM